MSPRVAVVPLATLLLLLSGPAFGQIVLPWVEGFEGTSGETYTTDTAALTGATDWAYENTDPSGRLRTAAGAGYARTGAAAATLDRDPAGGDQTNYLTFTGDLSQYDVAADTVVLDFGLMDHGEEPHASDRAWARGSTADSWVEIADLNALAGPVGVYEFVEDLNVSGALAAAGQQFTTTFQLRFGQEDDSPSTGIAGVDGLSFDDVGLRLIGPDDVAATDVLGPPVGACGTDAMFVEVEVTNFGGNSVSNVPVEVTTTDADGVATVLSGVVAGPLAFLEAGTALLGPVDLFVGGATDFAVTTLFVGDTDPSNDAWVETIELAPGAVPMDPVDGACPGWPTTLHVAAEGATTYTWWDAETGGNQIATGSSYTTPVLAAEATYWVERTTTTGSSGPVDNTIGTGGWFLDYDDGLVFDVAVPSSLDSVLVYAEAAGDLTINLEDGAGNVLDSTTTAVVTGANVVSVGFALPVGTGWVLNALGTTVSGLYRNTGGGVFPYTTAGGEVTITGNVNGLADYYYWFYDWQVSSGGCDDARTEVVVPVAIEECDTDLAVTVTGPDEIVSGTQVEYAVQVVNDGPDPLTALEVNAADPDGLTWAGGAGDCPSFPCVLADLPSGGIVSFTATYDAPPDLAPEEPVEFKVLSTPTGGETDPDPSDDEGSLSLPVVQHVDLHLDVTEEADPVIVGGTAAYLVHVENAGPSATDVVVHSQLPAEFRDARTLVDVCEEGEAALPDCTLGSLGPGEWLDVLYEGDVPHTTRPDTVTSIWTAVSSAVETSPGDETWAELTELAIGADLELTMTVFAENVIAGGTFDVALRVVNRGPDPVAQGTVALHVPDGVEAATLPSGCERDLVCELDQMTFGEYAEVVVPLRSRPDARGSLTITATAASERPDPDDEDNSRTEEFEYRFAAELVASARVAEGPWAGGDAVRVDVDVENVGPSDVDGVVVVFDMPPAGLTVVGCELDELNDTVCAVPGPLPVGETASVVVEMTAAEDALGTFSIPVSARSDAASVGDGSTVLEVTIGPDAGAGCEDCESSVASASATPAGLLLLALVGLRRRR